VEIRGFAEFIDALVIFVDKPHIKEFLKKAKGDILRRKL